MINYPPKRDYPKDDKDKLATLGRNYLAERAPLATDDSASGYAVWDKWLDQDGGEAYICLDATEGAAVWELVSLDAADLAGLFNAKADKVVPAADKNIAQLDGTTGNLEDSGITAGIGTDQFTVAGGTGTARTLTVDETASLSGKVDKETGKSLVADTDIAKIHSQNTDTGTTSGSFQIDSGNAGPNVKNDSGTVKLRNAADDADADMTAKDGTFSGAVSAGLPRVVKAATGSLSAADMRGCLVTNKGQAADAVVSLPAVFEGAHCLVCLETTVAKYWRLDPDASEVIIFDGTTLTGGYYVGIASAVDGAMLSVVARYAETTLVWDIQTLVGTWAAQA